MENNNRKGVIRALLAVLFSVVGFCMLMLSLLGYGEVPSWYIAMWGSTVSFYFGGEYGRQKPEA